MKKVLSIMLAAFLILSMDIFAFAVTDTEFITELSDDGRYLYVFGAEDLSDINVDFSKAYEIYLKNCTIRGDEEIFNIPKLRILSFRNCNFTGDSINFPDKLEQLYFFCTVPTNLSPLKKCEKLNEFEIHECRLKDLSAFSDIGKIKKLRFVECDIESVAGIEKGNEINTLGFYKVPIESIDELGQVKGLENLELSDTAVRDLSPLSTLDLYSLDIADSLMIESLDVILGFENLYDMCTLNCQMLYTPEIIEFLEERDISSHYEEGDLELKQKVLGLCSDIEKKYLTDEEKIGATVQKVCDMITYDYEVYSNDNLSLEYGNNIIKYAFKGTGCCSTYTGMVSMMLNTMGIDCYSLSGNNHIWNLVELDGYYYWLDATWIDTGWCEYLDESPYYMVTGEEFEIEHPHISMPPSVKNNPHSFDGVFECKTRFMVKDYFSDEVIDEKPTNPEITSAPEKTTEEETSEKATEKEITTDETTTEKQETVSNEKSKKPIIAISVSVVALSAIAVTVFVVMKKRKNNSL